MKFFISEKTKEEIEQKIAYLEAKEPFIKYVPWKNTYGEWKAYTNILNNSKLILEEDYECKNRD